MIDFLSRLLQCMDDYQLYTGLCVLTALLLVYSFMQLTQNIASCTTGQSYLHNYFASAQRQVGGIQAAPHTVHFGNLDVRSSANRLYNFDQTQPRPYSNSNSSGWAVPNDATITHLGKGYANSSSVQDAQINSDLYNLLNRNNTEQIKNTMYGQYNSMTPSSSQQNGYYDHTCESKQSSSYDYSQSLGYVSRPCSPVSMGTGTYEISPASSPDVTYTGIGLFPSESRLTADVNQHLNEQISKTNAFISYSTSYDKQSEIHDQSGSINNNTDSARNNLERFNNSTTMREEAKNQSTGNANSKRKRSLGSKFKQMMGQNAIVRSLSRTNLHNVTTGGEDMTHDNNIGYHRDGSQGDGRQDQQLSGLTARLEQSLEEIDQLKKQNSSLRERLSDRAYNQLINHGTTFENLDLGDQRPTALIQRYNDLYTGSRLDALDELDAMSDFRYTEELKQDLLSSLVMKSFSFAQQAVAKQREEVCRLLGAKSVADQSLADIQASMLAYHRRLLPDRPSCASQTEANQLLVSTLHQKGMSMKLTSNTTLVKYLQECLTLAWALTVQNSSYVPFPSPARDKEVDEKDRTYRSDRHERFHTSEAESQTVRRVLWPGLVGCDSSTSEDFIACKAVVVT